MPVLLTNAGSGLTLVLRDYAESSFLMHYRVGGEKKGVRRWQNKDGSLTTEGYQHYAEMYGWGKGQKSTEFQQAESDIRAKLSNDPKPIQKKTVDVGSVRKRSGVSETDAKKCVDLAEEAFRKASEAEPKITADVTSVVSKSGAKMYGLENRLKQPTSIAGKIGSDAKKDDISYEQAAKDLKDLIRYTSISDDDKFVENYNRVKADLESKGYEEIRCRNYFDQYAQGKVQHKSVQSVFRDKDGNTFEMQFQTEASQAAKELKIPLYERRRSEGLSDSEKSDLERQMHDLADQVHDPKNVSSIKEHDKSEFREGNLAGSVSAETKKRMSTRNDNAEEADTEYTKQVLSQIHIPVESLNELDRLPKNADLHDVRYSINHPVDEANVLIHTKDGGEGYLADTGRHFNCPNCACAFELTERGYSVSARRATDGSNVGDIEKYFGNGRLESIELSHNIDQLAMPSGSRPRNKAGQRIWDEKARKFEKELMDARLESVADLQNKLYDQGNGARGIIVVGWLMNADLHNRTTFFHALNYKVEGDKLTFYDTQSRRKCDGFTDPGYFMGCDPRELHFMRTDTLELDESITQTVYSRGRGSK